MLAVLSGLTGAATGFFNPASTGLLPAIVPRRAAAGGQRACARPRCRGGEIAGPAIAGVLIAGVGAGLGARDRRGDVRGQRAFLARLRLPARVPRAAASFIADLREGWGVFRSLTWVWAFVVAAGAREHALGRVGDARAGGRRARPRRRRGLGDRARRDGHRRADRRADRRARSPAAAAGARRGRATALFVFPLAFLAAGAPVAVLAVGALLGGVAMMLGNSVWESTLHAPRPGRVALARERLRLVRLARLQAARAGDLGADRGADRHLALRLGGRRRCWPCDRRGFATPAIRRRSRLSLARVEPFPSDANANMCSCPTSSSTRTPPSPSWTAHPRPRSWRRRRSRPGMRRWRSPTTTACRARWSSRWRPSRWACGRSTGSRWIWTMARHVTLLVEDARRLAQPVPDRHAGARARPRASTSRRRRCRWRRWRSTRPGSCC